MRCLFPLALALVAGFSLVPEMHAQAPKARRYVPSKCDVLCDNLTIAIQKQPDNLVMRLEDALVINERCAGEIVAAAITAVNAEPRLVDQIVRTALNVAPNRRSSILYSVNNFVPRAPAAILAEEIRRPELPVDIRRPESSPGNIDQMIVEVRRAERPDSALPTPLEEVRKAEVPSPRAVATTTDAAPPTEEIRKAVPNLASGSSKESFVGKSTRSAKRNVKKDS